MSLNMQQQLAAYDFPVAPVDPDDQVETAGWVLKTLKPKHKKVCSLIAQGVDRCEIARIMDITPQYVTMLAKQPKCIDFIKEINDFAGLQLEGMFGKTVEVISDVMQNGDNGDRLKAARLQLEVTKRIGPRAAAVPDDGSGTEARLNSLGERLISLLTKHREGDVAAPIEDAEFTVLGANNEDPGDA